MAGVLADNAPLSVRAAKEAMYKAMGNALLWMEVEAG
jgi:hypothetical protein